jgi:hypothetical protein
MPFEPWNLNPNVFENGGTGSESILTLTLPAGTTTAYFSKYKYGQFTLALLFPSQLFPSDVSVSGPNFLPI